MQSLSGKVKVTVTLKIVVYNSVGLPESINKGASGLIWKPEKYTYQANSLIL
jgi:hypothetical protein